MGKTVEAKEVKEQIVEVPVGTLEELVSRLPEGVQERAAKQADEFESPYIEPEGMVMVLDISTGALAQVDGWPGEYDVEFGDERLKGTGLKEQREVTKQQLVKRYRFKVEINMLPTTEYKYDFNIVPLKEWQEHAKTKGGSGMTDAQTAGAFMLRAGGAT